MIKPKRLYKGDKIATISLSWGAAGDIPHRYAYAKNQIEKNFELEVVETKNALKSADWISKNPEARANDLMEALEDKSIKAIISNIGGEDSIRTLKYMDFNIIKNNPKIFVGFSDTTVSHFCFYKSGITSFYGTSTFVGFAENNGMHQYQIEDTKNTFFNSNTLGKINPNTKGWTSERLQWEDINNQSISRKLEKNTPWRFLQGKGIVQGKLLGGCIEVLEFLRDTSVWVSVDEWKEKIMFIETSEVKMSPANFRWIIRNYAASGILKNLNGLILGRPYDDLYAKEYDEVLLKIIREEEGLNDLPIITGMDFGHTSPSFSIPYGINAEINCDEKTFSIVENALIS